MRRVKLLNQAGDTIVEVLIVIAILGLAFSISYATANHGLIQSRNAEEHSEALGIINSQLELVRAAFANGQGTSIPPTMPPVSGNSFCMPDPANTLNVTTFASKIPTLATADVLTHPSPYPDPCFVNNLYYTSVTYRIPGAGQPYFDFLIRWDGLGSLGRQQEEITYRISP